MDNSSQNSEEKEVKQQDSADNSSDDIKFEEVINIDDIQKKLQEDSGEDIPEDDSEVEVDEMFESEENSSEETSADTIPSHPVENINPEIKKYVIYVENDNINYIDSLSIDGRREVINKILREQNKITEEEKALQKRKQFLSQIVTACITFILCFPILFIIVSKSTDLTVDNYQQVKKSFSELYKEQGKIKMKKTR